MPDHFSLLHHAASLRVQRTQRRGGVTLSISLHWNQFETRVATYERRHLPAK